MDPEPSTCSTTCRRRRHLDPVPAGHRTAVHGRASLASWTQRACLAARSDYSLLLLLEAGDARAYSAHSTRCCSCLFWELTPGAALLPA
ncbi:MAG: hypothetical protein MZV65_17820 [Chromatiales bacterium]|nr:hypothetical protein [Chromatiales bacterium]